MDCKVCITCIQMYFYNKIGLVSILCSTYKLRHINHINLDQVYHSKVYSMVLFATSSTMLETSPDVKCLLRPNFFGKFLQQQWRRWQSLHLQFLKFPIELVHNVIIDSVLLRNAFNQRTLFELPTFIVWPTKKNKRLAPLRRPLFDLLRQPANLPLFIYNFKQVTPLAFYRTITYVF